MKILYNNNDLNEALYGVSDLGFVPTMGSLHAGHVYLIKKSLKQCKKTIVSIFINPTQFNNKMDYKKYPKNHNKDLLILKKLKVNFVYMPKKKDVYNSKLKPLIKLNKKDKILCAKYRKGHFEGVIDVMKRLTNIIKPQKIFMGEKDFQQLYLVKKYIEKSFKTKIIPCKTIRDTNKIALSSRNLHLSSKDFILASKLAKELILYKKRLKNIKNIKNIKETISLKKDELSKIYKVKIEYLELRNIYSLNMTQVVKNSKLFISYYLNKIRLIDNF